MIENARGQITIYIFLGVFVLILFSFIIYLNSNIETSPINEGLDSVKIVRYMEQCMQTKVESTVDLLFKQGGWLYEEDGGYIPSASEFVRTLPLNNLAGGNRQTYITYGILDETSSVYQVPQNYKRPLNSKNTFGQPIGVFNTDVSTPYFGKNVLPKLCNRNGPNGINAEVAFTCLPELYNRGDLDENNTVQSQLNRALDGSVFSCIQDAQKQYDFSYEGDGSVNVIFGDTKIELPINITLTSATFRKPLAFSYDLRIKQVYSFAYLFIDKDIRDINFDKRSDASKITSCSFDGRTCYDESMLVTVFGEYVDNNPDTTTIPGNNFDDIVTIVDRKSPLLYTTMKNTFVEDDYLTFQFAVENRRPYIDVMPNLPTNGKIIGDDFSSTALTEAERTFSFFFTFYDPDEDEERMYKDKSHYSIVRSFGSNNPEYYSPAAGSRIGFNNPSFASLDVFQRTDGEPGLEGEIIISCSEQCKHIGTDFKDPDQFFASYYSMKATVNDGELGLNRGDFQTFDIVVFPR
jgi:hypothetical protein